MTGYGRGEASNGGVTVVIELKSVNNRFRDLQLRCPREYMPLEPRFNRALKGAFQRGRIEVFVRRAAQASGTRVHADALLAADYAQVINDVASEMVGFVEKQVPFTFILQQPGVLTIVEAEVDALAEWSVVEAALKAAIADLTEMRVREGRALFQELRSFLDIVSTLVGEIEAATVQINERLRVRLEARIKRLIGDRFDPYRIEQEVALLADKADVSEEITRLRSHCSQFGDALESGEPVGRRLDFLLQEMNREVNTIGSKAAEHPLSSRVVELKSTLERMREQSANVE